MNSATPDLASLTYRVYTKYILESLPPSPGKGWTRFVCASDTHRKTMPVADGDILIHAGDFTSFTSGFRSSLEWIKGLHHPRKLLIAGNHEYNLDNRCIESIYSRDADIRAELAEDRRLLRDETAVEANLTYLEAESTTVSASDKIWTVYGSPYTPEYGTMGFYYQKHEANATWAPVPQNTEIMITHGPPYGILDVARRARESVGCPALEQTVLHRLSKLRLHVFGHIHEGRGAEVRRGAAGQDVVFVNAACQDHKNTMPIIVDLRDDTGGQTNGNAHTG